MQHGPEKDNNLSIIIGQLMVRDYAGLNTSLDQVSKNLQTYIRDDREVNPPVI